METVLFSPIVNQETIRKLSEKLISQSAISSTSTVAIKVHFGEEKNTRYIKPQLIKPIVDHITRMGCKAFISDCNTLYRGRRVFGSEHKRLAEEHGFGTLGIPIVIGDGERGDEETMVPVEGKHFSSVRIGKAFEEADTLIIISHFKGHSLEGFGGAIKNAGMGMGSRRGKMEMHACVIPTLNPRRCTACAKCLDYCDHGAISMRLENAEIAEDRCVGCAMCIAVCPSGAIQTPWGSSTSNEVIEKTAEYALGAVSGKTVIAINFIIDITADCDCLPNSDILSEDVGIAAGTDLCALDQACYDLVREKNGGRDVFAEANRVDGLHIVRYGYSVGLGGSGYVIERYPH